MAAVARILDANANRAREAFRVLEDSARFALEDESLCGALKSLRHDLREALAGLPAGWLEAARDTAGDVGTRLATDAERERRGLADVVTAAGKRLGESLRVIEETGKTIDADLARKVEALRYRFYDVERDLQGRLGSGRARQWRLCLLLVEASCRRPWRTVLAEAVEAGCDCVQVREKSMDGGPLAARVRQVVETARPRQAAVIVNDRLDVALAAGADGVHLGPGDLGVADARRVAGRTLLVGASCHGLDEAGAAVTAGCDYCGVGTMFASHTKPGAPPTGPEGMRGFVERFPRVPHLAIGGIDLDNIDRVIEAGARGVAVCAAICGADRPGDVAGALREKLERMKRRSDGAT